MGGRTVVSDDDDEIEEEEGGRDGGNEGVNVDQRDDDDDEEDEEEEGQDEYEKDGFIVDDVEEEEEEEENKEDSDEEKHRKKKKKRRESEKNFVLDEDDYELLQDNNITGFHRPKPGSKFKRLKKAGRDELGERSGLSDDEESDRNIHGSQKSAEERLKHRLFGDDEGAPLEDIAEEEQLEEEEDADIIGDDDEMADFIVDEEEDFDENGVVVKKKKIQKKKVRQAPGVSSSALQEAHEIFGDVDELLMLRKQGIARDASDAAGYGEKRLEDEFEPFILSEKYMTAKDDSIRETDVAERIQMSEDITGSPPTEDEIIAEESAWIYQQLIDGGVSPQVANLEVIKEKRIDKEDIGRVLTIIHVSKLDLPFIAMYRKEWCLSLLKDTDEEGDEKIPRIRWHKLLWAVHNLDRKWLLLQKRKSALQLYYSKRFDEESRRVDDETRHALNQKLFESISKALVDANSEREVDDVDAKFNLHLPPGEAETDEGQFKRPKRKSLYSICYKAGLWEVANKFGYSSEKFGSFLNKYEVSQLGLEDGKETPEEIAANFTCAMFETPADVLKGARHMAAVEIGCEPSVKKFVRGTFMEKAVVSTSPTPEGNTAIDVYHELASVKWLKNKPLSEFADAQWLCIQKAEEEKLLQVTVKLPESVQKDLLADAKENYLSDCVSKSAQLWNEQREKILDDAFSNFILPSMEKEARALLTSRAKNWLLMEYGSRLWSKVSVAPYQKKEANNDDEESDLRVMACCWGPGKPATTFVMLDSAGEMVDVLYAGSISVRSQAVAEKQRKQLDQQRLLKFMTDHQPHVVCLGTANLSCRALKDDIYEVIFRIVEDHPRDVSQDMNIGVVFGDESLPRLYENSRISSDQLPGQPGIVKRAVGLGRYLQNPLAMIATLCGPGKEILSWKLGPLEQFLSDDEKFEMVEQVMIDATNQVGLDINLAASHEWLFAPLQFISGLGPRKASALQRAFVRAGSIFNRKEIPMGKIVRKKVFINAAGFLRVRRGGAAAISNHIMDLLDDTRIHPESYDLAKKLARDVRLEDFPDEMDDDDQEMAIELVRDKPEMLKALDIDAYSESYYKDHESRKRETFYLIKMELLHGFQDWRVPFTEPNPDEEFFMLSGETEDSLSNGKLVQVVVRQVQDSRVMCMFDSGLKGFIMAEDFSDDGYDPEKVHEGEVLTCKIKSVNRQRVLVYLTCRGSELSRKPHRPENVDRYYQEDDMNLRSEQEKARKEKELAKKHFKPRMIVHPNFQNWTADEAKQYLADKEPGARIVRPSSKGPSFLTLTLKIYDGVYAHKDIVEGGKDHKDITSLLRIGKTLTIDKETFEDLDEVMVRYVEPLVENLRNMLGYRKFKTGKKQEVDNLLKAEKSENPMRIVYCFSIAHDHPGTFMLSYIRSSNPHHEYIGLYPKGFRFRKKDFENIDRLVSYFQRNIDKPPPDGGPSLRTVAAMVPYSNRSPAAWGSSGDGSGGGNDGGWRERSSTPGSRSGGRPDYKNNYGDNNRDGHPSGVPRPGRGRGRGGGRGRGRGRDSDFGSSPRWGASDSRNEDDGGMSSFPGAKVHNSPGKERFPGGWGNDGNSGGGGGGTWGSNNDNSNGGPSWGSSGGGDDAGRGSGGPSWGGGGGGDTGGWGGGSWGGGGGEAAGSRGPGGSDWGGGSKRLVPPQADNGNGWSGGGGGGGGGW